MLRQPGAPRGPARCPLPAPSHPTPALRRSRPPSLRLPARSPQVLARALGGRVGKNPSGKFVVGAERLELTRALAGRKDFALARARRHPPARPEAPRRAPLCVRSVGSTKLSFPEKGSLTPSAPAAAATPPAQAICPMVETKTAAQTKYRGPGLHVITSHNDQARRPPFSSLLHASRRNILLRCSPPPRRPPVRSGAPSAVSAGDAPAGQGGPPRRLRHRHRRGAPAPHPHSPTSAAATLPTSPHS